jgi:regulatory protein
MTESSSNENSKSIRHKALDLLARREHSQFELLQKLAQRGYEHTEIEDCISALVRDNLLSDERFTEAYVRMRSRKGFGYRRILQELQQKGIDGFLAERYLTQVEWLPLVEKTYHKKYGAKPIDDFSERAKRLQFLTYRGYQQDEINELLGDD